MENIPRGEVHPLPDDASVQRWNGRLHRVPHAQDPQRSHHTHLLQVKEAMIKGMKKEELKIVSGRVLYVGKAPKKRKCWRPPRKEKEKK